ncbi:putative reverse transcriptase domain, ribonuclease H-like domain, aspartic peptidase domain protein [Tanacetum coccineum]
MVNDSLHIESSDHPGMMLTNTPFHGGNFLGWSRTIKMALGEKVKLGFIVGSLPKSAVIDGDYHRWIRCDYMVTCWILNSMVSELSESFLYAQSARDLWKIWPNCGKLRECTCGVTEKFIEIDTTSKLMQFLMRLNDDFKAVRNQILSMDPLPNLNKAYYIV